MRTATWLDGVWLDTPRLPGFCRKMQFDERSKPVNQELVSKDLKKPENSIVFKKFGVGIFEFFNETDWKPQIWLCFLETVSKACKMCMLV